MVTTTELIVQSDFSNYRELGSAINYAKRVTPHVLAAQEIDLQGLLGEAFYSDVAAVADAVADTANLTLVNYTALLPYLKPIIVNYALARLTGANQTSVTAYSIQQHTNEWSKNVGENTLSRMIKQDESAARHYADKMVRFLDSNSDNYPTWRTSEGDTSRTAIRITKISRD